MQTPENDVMPAKARSIPVKRLIFTLVCAAFAAWFISYRMDYRNWYAPIFSAEEMQIPRRMGDYTVLGVMTSDTSACIPSDNIQVLLQPAKDADGPAEVPFHRDMVHERGFITWMYFDENTTLEKIIAHNDAVNRIYFIRECARFSPFIYPPEPD